MKDTCSKCGKVKENKSHSYCRSCLNEYARFNAKRYKGFSYERKCKAKARSLVQQRLKSGKMIKSPCFCGSWEVEAHHNDYEKPLEVIWLCKLHHMNRHGAALSEDYQPPPPKPVYLYDKNEKEWYG